MMRLLAQLVLSLAVVEMVPTSVPALESAHLPSAREEPAVVREVSRLLSPELPIDRALRPPRNADPESLGVITSAVSAIVVDKGSGQVLFEKNTGEVRPVGSLTKLLSAAVFLETHPDLDAPASVLKEDLRSGGRDHLYVDDE
ncbi:MAG: D-alanyl-D-alanine carboxypeptidase, partial [Candidatus Uhrbacteria bacterium GW2011_GWC2_53_7]